MGSEHVKEIEELAGDFTLIGAESPFERFAGYYYFKDAMMANADEALAHMRGLLTQAQRGKDVSVPSGPAAEVRRDGRTVARFPGANAAQTENGAWTYILHHQAQSVDWAIRYEGWAIVRILADGTEHVNPQD